MTVPVVFPVAGQRVVAVLLGQWLVFGQRLSDANEIFCQRNPVRPFGLALQIALQRARLGCRRLRNCTRKGSQICGG